MPADDIAPIEVFISYSHKDDALREELGTHLSLLKRERVIDEWHDRRIVAGQEWGGAIHEHLNSAAVILLLVSADFLASDYCYDIEMKRALERHDARDACVIPVILRSVDWQGAPFAKLQALPRDGRPLTSWPNKDEAFTDVARAIRKALKDLPASPSAGPSPRAGREVAGRSRVQRLPDIWNVPYLRNPNFTGRDELLDDLHGKLENGRTALTAVSGMGGVGKTQLALEYAYRHAGEFDLVWWLRAEEPATLLEDYAALAKPLGLNKVGEGDLAALVHAVCEVLTRRDRWLLVFDNASEPHDVMSLLPRAGLGRVLVTSRNPGWPFAVPLKVPLLSREAAIRFLLDQTNRDDREAADAVANELGDLPLALAQAAAYVTETGVGLASYVDLLRNRRRELWAEEKPPEGYPATIGTTMATDRLRTREPVAVDLLRLCAFLAPETIPRRLLSEHHAVLPSKLGDAVADPLRLNRLVGLLRRYSLVDITGEGLTFHRLVQAATRDALTDHAMRRWLKAAVALMNAGFPYVEDDPATWTPSGELLPHAFAAAGHAERFVKDLPDTARLLNEAASFLETRGEFDRARATYRRTLELAEKALGPCHPKVATYVNNLGHVLKAQADLSAARACFERALAIDEAAFGLEHPNVASGVNNLGLVLRAQGDLAGALACFERAMQIFESHLGSEHPDVATIVNNRGTALQDLGDLAGARACYEQALVIDQAAFGLEHPNVAIRLNNLGSVLKDMGDLAGARAHFTRALSIFEKFLPTDHPYVTKTRSHLQMTAEEEVALAKN